MAQTLCKINTIVQLTPSIFEVTLLPQTPIKHKAGQYLKIVMTNEDQRPFSIANPTINGNELILQIGAHPENPYAWEVLEKLRESDSIMIDAPHGNAFLRESEHPLLLIAGGTGFSYIYAILQQALKTSMQQPIELFWGVRNQQDLYYLAHLNQLANEHANFHFHPVVEHPSSEWKGLTGWVHKAAIENIDDLSRYDVYVAGRFEMAKVLRDDFYALGLSSERLFGDAFDYL